MLPGNRFARLSDIAVVRDSVGEIRSISRSTAARPTTFGVYKAKGFSDVTVLDAVHRRAR